MLCCGLGKQKPHVHSGKLWEGGAEEKKTSMLPGFVGQRDCSYKQGWTFTPLVVEGVEHGWETLVSATQALQLSLSHSWNTAPPVPAVLRCGTVWGFLSRDCREVGMLSCRNVHS